MVQRFIPNKVQCAYGTERGLQQSPYLYEFNEGIVSGRIRGVVQIESFPDQWHG